MVQASQVMDLRKKTGAGMMECKKVLLEAEGNEEKAIELLKERGILKAAKKSSRIASEGMVGVYVSEDKKKGALCEVNSETDFVASNEEFVKFVQEVAEQITVTNPKNVEELLEQKSIFETEKTVQEVLTDKIAKIGENLNIRRFVRYETDKTLATYIHGNGKIGVIVELEGQDEELGKDICMQIAAAKPEYIDEKDVPEERLNKEKEILKAQVVNEGKPENVAEKIVEGRLGKFFEEICLLNQVFVKEQNMKIKELLKSKNSNIIRFDRLEKGEGIEKKEENFAEEVAKQLQ